MISTWLPLASSADSGVASHWLYKEEKKTLTELQHKTHSWLQ